MRACHSPDSIGVTFDDDHAVASAGLLLAATLAEGLMLRELLDTDVDLGNAPGAANVADKAMTLIHSALAGGEWIDDANALRAGATGQLLGHRIAAPSTLGTFLRSFTWGSARQLDQIAGEALRRAWQAGAGPGPWPLTIDIDATHCQTYGLAKQGATGSTGTATGMSNACITASNGIPSSSAASRSRRRWKVSTPCPAHAPGRPA